ncbi:HAAS signaling domain-containing protein [Winogradskya humida]|uniref:YD repeat-containing protein n=1 Tax=Winogradskya humida TaxID=113566 RepID=A0ABQ3ZLC8_9ACTN|nr:hypothetical protein [Actinoplanes humidus]GIE18997.1 hypothetical protein Ahu01nite_020990 [Actinoplanes humidus]
MNSTAQDEITAYVFAVRAALGDLPEAQRDELLEDLTEHLTEVMADGEGPLTDRVGSPEAYAAELRGTAPFVGGFPDPPTRPNPLIELRDQVMPVLRTADVKVGGVLGYERASDFGRLLRPAWWVLRGYLAAMVVAEILDGGDQPIGLLPRIGGSDAVALILLAAGILGSIWLGRRSFRLSTWPKAVLYGTSFVLVIVALAGFTQADGYTRDSYYSNVTSYDNPYSQVEDVFVYDAQGRLVTGARLLDQNGQPIHLGNAYCYDDEGTYIDAPQGVYPYCASKAPFRMPDASDAPSVSPSASGGGEPSPSPGKPSPSPSK